MSGCGADGSALPWGGRGRGFKSRHSDHILYGNALFLKQVTTHYFFILSGVTLSESLLPFYSYPILKQNI